MRWTTVVALSGLVCLSATPAMAKEEWKWGVNFYDLQLHSAVDPDSEVEADICSSALTQMASMMLDTEPDSDGTRQILYLSGVWKEEGAKRRGLDLETYTKDRFLPAFGLMRDLDVDHHLYWVEQCLEITRKALPPE